LSRVPSQSNRTTRVESSFLFTSLSRYGNRIRKVCGDYLGRAKAQIRALVCALA
jgi:hypothetical protein